MASLVALDGTSFELAEQETLVGRGGREVNDPPKADVGVLEGGTTVSRQHARIFRRGDQWFLRNELSARNPTVLGDTRIPGGEERLLADGARIQLGDVVLTFKAPRPAAVDAFDATMIDEAPPAPIPIVAPPLTTRPQAPVQEAPVQTSAPMAPPAASAVVQMTPSAAATATWAERLPARPAAVAALGITEFKRVNPFRGLMVDETTWADAHDYHRSQLRLHLLNGHGWGIVEGLEVVADQSAPNRLVVRPGIAIDADGRALVLARELRLSVPAEAGATLYVALRLREELADPQRFWNDLDEYTRVVERCEVIVQRSQAGLPTMELARVVTTGSVRNAVDPLNPQAGEIDLRFRERVAVRPRAELGVAQLVTAGSAGDQATVTHRVGLRYLLREIGLTTVYRPRWAGVCQPGDAIPAVSLLYITGSGGFTIDDDATLTRLREFLDGGGVLMADVCQAGKAAEFAAAAELLAKALGRQPQPVGRWHPVLTARHLFNEPPLAGKVMTLTEGGGFVLSTVDYGCAWQGGREGQTLGREAIRASLELGVNVAVYARRRQQPLEAIDLEA